MNNESRIKLLIMIDYFKSHRKASQFFDYEDLLGDDFAANRQICSDLLR